ncbi:hypothetical protein DsansV1_C13g0118351 [Dioscorea sansibarensis]
MGSVSVDDPLEQPSPEKGVEEEEEMINDNPIEQVRLTVPITDDPTLPALTFRTWSLGLISCAFLAFLNQFFGYRQNALYNIFGIGTNRRLAGRASYGQMASGHRRKGASCRVVFLTQSRAIQPQRTCLDYHLCQLWFKLCLCC